ncbi:AIPR family protein [Anaerorhabdus sp.]|uniref:AIPR family protein n=1 Tax=Anaerorhabdus sp. TaxID=1872524 RepID=UPI002FCB4763
MKVEEYREVLHEDIALAANANMTNANDEFLQYVTDILSVGEEFDDFIECYYEGMTKQRGNIRIDGYAMDETDGSCCVFIADYHGPFEGDSIKSEEITKAFKKIRYFVDEATKYELYQELEESTEAYEFARTLYYDNKNISKFRFYLLTDAYNNQRTKNIKDGEVAGKKVELNVWDISRIFDIVSSTTQKESVEIVLGDLGYSGIPCVKAVEYEDVIADIEVMTKFDDIKSDEEENGKPENVITYSSYLAVVPGQVLNDLYLEYGSRLLEGNVRSFLSIRGKVNKSIQTTIKNYPEMFFAYNNGIAATATELDTKMTDRGLVITRIKDLQIVNGGQTTASIANTLLSARKDENFDLSRLFVPMKVSVLEHSMSERIIPKISEYSNSQNKVDASDFFSNHPFHIRMEDYSRKTPAPTVNGNQFQQYWYYERTRGQYNQGKMKFKPKSSQMKQYENRYPDNQVIKMVELAKYMEIYEGAPDKVSKGKQAIVKVFAEEIKMQWNKSDVVFNLYYFKRVVALAIMFHETDEIIKSTIWYKEKHSYKANVIAYTMSVIFDYIKRKFKGHTIDFTRIWNNQGLYEELRSEISVLCEEVYEFIIRDDRQTENVTEWCKKEECWQRAKKQNWTFKPEFLETLISEEEIRTDEDDAKKLRKVENEVDEMKFILAIGKEYWKQVISWGTNRNMLSSMESDIIQLIINMDITGRIPTDKQAKVAMKARARLIANGMPMQF